MPENNGILFNKFIESKLMSTGNCWVSTHCYLPINFLNNFVYPLLDSYSPYLRVFLNSVIKRAQVIDR